MGPSSDIKIVVEPNPGDVAGEIERNLLASLRGNSPASDYAQLAVVAHDDAGALVGGLVGSTSYGWLLVKALWVADTFRNRELGTQLVEAAERLALTRGCHGAWLDTSSARASHFYARLGYRTFGRLENAAGEHPQGHSRFFMCKRLPRGDRDVASAAGE